MASGLQKNPELNTRRFPWEILTSCGLFLNCKIPIIVVSCGHDLVSRNKLMLYA